SVRESSHRAEITAHFLRVAECDIQLLRDHRHVVAHKVVERIAEKRGFEGPPAIARVDACDFRVGQTINWWRRGKPLASRREQLSHHRAPSSNTANSPRFETITSGRSFCGQVSTSARFVSPVSVRMPTAPASRAMRMSVYNRSPTKATSYGARLYRAKTASSICGLGFPGTKSGLRPVAVSRSAQIAAQS